MKRRWLPDSILARTALVLVAALAVALALALALFAVQRHEALAALGGRHSAERVAGLVSLLDETPPEARRHTLRSMDSPGFRAGWANEPVATVGGGDSLGEAVGRQLRARLEGRTVLVSTGHGPVPGRGYGRMMHGVPGMAILISVQLTDGSWLNVIAPVDPADPLWRPGFVLPLVFALMAVTLAALWAVRRTTGPFATFAAAAERLGVDVSAPPLTEDGPREVRLAAHAFNTMQDRIRRFVGDRTQMLAAISHDLRTPITRLKLRAEFVEDEDQRARMLADLDEMERMIAATLAFARDDATSEIRRPLDLAALLQGLIDDLTAGGHHADYHGPDSVVVAARPIALKRALANLLDNAIKYGGTARSVLVDSGSEVAIVVEDDGPGIPEADMERAFAPFVRLEASRNRETGGSGLGLAVARAAVRAHGGDIRLENRAEGGLRARLILPRSA